MEIDVDRLKSEIREAALKRPLRPVTLDPPRSPSPGNPTRLNLTPEFVNTDDMSYHVNDLLRFHDRDFIRNAYRAILKREPDQKGSLHNLELLQSGVFNKLDILAGLRYSDEGKQIGVRIIGLQLPVTVRKLERLPIIGYLLQLLIAVLRLPSMIRSQRQFQGYIVAQQLAIADHLNESQSAVTGDLQRHSAALEFLSTFPNELKGVEQQLRALETNVLTLILDEQQKLQLAEARLALVTDRLTNVTETLSQTRAEVSVKFAEQLEALNSLTTDLTTLSRNVADEANRSVDELREWDNFYASFEEQFRGSNEEVEERLRFYLPYLKDLNADSKILDLGSGRGDWLQLLTKEGFRPLGVEVNEVLAHLSSDQGLEVVNREMMAYLGQQPDNSFDLVTIFHLIEHFDVGRLISLLDEVRRTLKPGGLLMIETPSPENLVVAACNFYADPTHHKPIYPQTLTFLLGQKEFVNLDLQFLHPVDGSPFAGKTEGSKQLNNWLFGPRDFAVIARKAQ